MSQLVISWPLFEAGRRITSVDRNCGDNGSHKTFSFWMCTNAFLNVSYAQSTGQKSELGSGYGAIADSDLWENVISKVYFFIMK